MAPLRGEVEVETERTMAYNLTAGKGNGEGRREVLRVRYRGTGNRRWSTFLLVPDPGQSIDELEDHAEDAARRVAEIRGEL